MADTMLHLSIRGGVHGVGYRAWLSHEARAHGLSGWVRNRSDGTVEAVLSGSSQAVDAVVELCRRGPPAARVSGVETVPWDEVLPNGFNARATV